MPESWTSKNQQYLVAYIEQAKEMLRSMPTKIQPKPAPMWDDNEQPSALQTLCQTFGLSDFEKMTLLLCAGQELDSDVPRLCAQIHDNPNSTFPTFSIALALFSDPHWSALLPTSPLRVFRLVTPIGLEHVPLTMCHLKIEERVLHYLTGLSYLDRSMRGIVEQVRDDLPASESHDIVADKILNAWNLIKPYHAQIIGSDDTSNKTVASLVCQQLGFNLWQITADLLPQNPEELESLAQLWNRESALLRAALYLEASDSETTTEKIVRRFLGTIAGPAFLSTSQHWKQVGYMPAVEVSKPTKTEQKFLWHSLLDFKDGDDDLASAIQRVVNQFDLSAASILSASSEVQAAMNRGAEPAKSLWMAGRKVAAPSLSHLTQSIATTSTMDDLVIGQREKELLHSIIASTRQRYKVYEEWGFSRSSGRGLGISALFAGDSGTGKTTAAEAIAHELDLDLYRIDLAMVVNKYIGETEKNLKKIFDAAEDGGVILMFDEADALFGKRSEVKDSHDRYANIEVGYLLQRMESYRGLAILTTSMRNSLDRAFTRRIRFIVNFPFPDEKSRAEIWRKVFPSSVLLDGLDYSRLATLELTGGNIRNIALGAAFLAADEDAPIGMAHITHAAREEYDKLGRPFPAERIAA
jgi:AAA+ superfamily predicted ATPase